MWELVRNSFLAIYNFQHWETSRTKQFQTFWEKELRFGHKLWFSNYYIFTVQYRRPLIFQTLNSVRSNNFILKYQSFKPLGCNDIGIKSLSLRQKVNWVLATNSDFQLAISLQPDGVNLWYFKLSLFDLK